MAAQSALRGESITMRFGGVVALDEVDFDLPRGGAVGLLGQNGSGKTTLLNVLTGQLRPTSGDILVDGHKMNGVAPGAFAAAGISRVFQSIQIFGRLSVLDNLIVAQRMNGASRGRISASATLERVGLEGFAADRASDLSYGHQRLLEIAMALGSGAHIILLDEPTAGLSPVLVGKVVACLRQLNEEGVSLVLIEHETEIVFQLCNVIWVLHEGKVIAKGSADEIRADKRVLDLYLGAA
jgi:branched-chain amino acid transport system ATP-binding protein